MIAFGASIFVFFALTAGALALLAPPYLDRRAFEGRFRALQPRRGDAPRERGAPTLRRSTSAIPTLRKLLGRSAWAEAVTTELQQANVQLRAGEYLIIRCVASVVLFATPLVVLRFQAIGLLIALGGGVLGFLLPSLLVGSLRRRRIARVEKQLIEMLPLLASSLRAGFAFQQAVEAATQQLEPPLADELTLLLHDVNLGATMPSAVQDMGRRVGSVDLDMVITAILVQRTTGGNLSEILDQAAETLRERERIRGDLQTMTAQQRLTGFILSVYPVAVGLLLLAILPSVWSKLFTTGIGQIQLGVALGLQLLGFLGIRRALKIDF